MNAPQAFGPKRGSNVLVIVLAVVGLLGFMVIGTCAVGALWVKRETEQAFEAGSISFVATPDVLSALAGPKKDYVGVWKNGHGTTLTIDAAGNFEMTTSEDKNQSHLRAPISAFEGDDIKIGAVMKLSYTVKVNEPPRQVDGRWRMKAKGITLYRPIEN